MAEIIKAYRHKGGAVRFIGKQYHDCDRVNGTFGAKWGEWFENRWFDLIRKQFDENMTDMLEDGNAEIGLMRGNRTPGNPFEYWIGIFTPEGTAVPQGFDFIDFRHESIGVCWVRGQENDVYMHEPECCDRLKEEGFQIDAPWCFERYVPSRFERPDENGNIVLDICFFVK